MRKIVEKTGITRSSLYLALPEMECITPPDSDNPSWAPHHKM